jgi:ethanolamine ammonia-lyase large subunit
MKYKLENGKTVDIKDEELDNLCEKLDISLNDAIQLWLEDNGYEVNEEVEELTKKAKENRVTATVHGVVAKRTKKEVHRKEDLDKQELIKLFAEVLDKAEIDYKITNVEKLIEFEFNGANYKLDLIKRREKRDD